LRMSVGSGEDVADGCVSRALDTPFSPSPFSIFLSTHLFGQFRIHARRQGEGHLGYGWCARA